MKINQASLCRRSTFSRAYLRTQVSRWSLIKLTVKLVGEVEILSVLVSPFYVKL